EGMTAAEAEELFVARARLKKQGWQPAAVDRPGLTRILWGDKGDIHGCLYHRRRSSSCEHCPAAGSQYTYLPSALFNSQRSSFHGSESTSDPRGVSQRHAAFDGPRRRQDDRVLQEGLWGQGNRSEEDARR